MLPVDLVAFVTHASIAHPLQAIVLAQLWCPVCVRFVAGYKGSSKGAAGLAAAMVALYESLSLWRDAESPQWHWHQRYMTNCHQGGASMHFGPEAAGKRWGFLQDASNTKAAKAAKVVVVAKDGKEHILAAQKGQETFKGMSSALRGSKWDPVARAASPGAKGATRAARAASPGHGATGKVADLMTRFASIAGDVAKMGEAVSGSRMGQKSEYIRPHVCRKLFLSLMHASGWSFETFPWSHLTVSQMMSLGPDMQGYLANSPDHWKHQNKKTELFAKMDGAGGKKVPLVMHACWACLFGYATSTASNVGLGDRAVKYITEGHSEEFERCARALTARRGVPPTPLTVMREILVHGWPKKKVERDEFGWTSALAPALFPAEVPGLPQQFSTAPPPLSPAS